MTPPWPRAALLERIPPKSREALLSLGTAIRVPSGRTLLRQGEPGTVAYLLLSGCVKVIAHDGAGETLLAIRVGGDLVGEMSVLSGTPRSATVVTCAPTAARSIPAERLREFLVRHPETGIQVAAMISDRFRWSNERRLASAALDPRGRVSRVLLSLAERYGQDTDDGTDLGVPLTQADIAALAGIRLPTAEKVLRAFAGSGLLRLGYRRIRVLDPASLRALAAD
ncbi:Crp/Fnr family transcriptional regulator [Actinokineospora soli]|uniref:Crp/Fnr family transcriptional regulator n=1 Tax=Actinokineospora soli TaxID=1048753 RepID=A0ABW2TRZ8_9PSEU